MSDSVRPHRRQPIRLPRPWDSPGKNTGVGCHFLLQCMKVKSESEVPQSCPISRPDGLQPTRLLHPWDFPGKSTGVGCHWLLLLVLHYHVNITLKTYRLKNNICYFIVSLDQKCGQGSEGYIWLKFFHELAVIGQGCGLI